MVQNFAVFMDSLAVAIMKQYHAKPRCVCKLSSLVQHGVVQTLDYNIDI